MDWCHCGRLWEGRTGALGAGADAAGAQGAGR